MFRACLFAFIAVVCALGFPPSIYGLKVSSVTSGSVLWRNFVCHCRSLFMLLAPFLTFFLNPEFVPIIREYLEINLISVGL